MKIVTLRKDQFDNFAKNHRYRSYYQTSQYGNLMESFGYETLYLGAVNEQNNLIGATLILYKTIYLNFKFAYAPRGILYNYDNPDTLKEMTNKIKSVLTKKKFIIFRIDPYIPLTIRDGQGNTINFNNKGNEIIENLIAAGFEYKGKTLYFETEKPRWEALTLLNRDSREIFSKLDKRTRNKIRKASNSGLDIIIDQDQNISKLYDYINKKEHKPISYYEKLCKIFRDNIKIYYAKLNTETFIINSRRTYEKEIEYNKNLQEKVQDYTIDNNERELYINKKMESDKLITNYKKNMIESTKLLRENPDGMTVAGVMVLEYDNAAYIISEGFDEQHSYLNANYLLKWKIIEDYNNKGFKYINLNGVVGDFENKNEYSGLNEMKLGFNSTVTEYIGEFDLILNQMAINLYKKFNKDNEKKETKQEKEKKKDNELEKYEE